MAVYYNDNDPFVAAWLRNLIIKGLIADGEVDERSIVDVRGDDLRGYRQCHFFSGVGGWPLALDLATGARKIWRGRISHIRRPVADDVELWTGSCPCQPLSSTGRQQGHADSRHLWPAFYRLIAERRPSMVFGEQVANADGREWLAGIFADLADAGYACGAADLPAASVKAPHKRQRLFFVAMADAAERRWRTSNGMDWATRGEQSDLAWSSASLLGADRKTRRVEPGLLGLVNGVPGRMGRLRGYGNAVVPQVAALFIRAAMSLEAA